MSKMRPVKQQKNCPSCGAPIVSEICQYCGVATGLNTAEAQMEYPVLECKEATLGFWTIWFPMIFVVAFGLSGIIMIPFGLFQIIFFLIGLKIGEKKEVWKYLLENIQIKLFIFLNVILNLLNLVLLKIV